MVTGIDSCGTGRYTVRRGMTLSRRNSGAALFAGAAPEFARLAPLSRLTAHLVREFNRRWGTVTPSEEQSWRRSLTALAEVVRDLPVPEAGVGVELRLPLTDKRIDVSFVARVGRGEGWGDSAPRARACQGDFPTVALAVGWLRRG